MSPHGRPKGESMRPQAEGAPVSNAMATFVPVSFPRRGVRRLAVTAAPAHDATLLEGLGRAFYWQQLLDTGKVASGSEIARLEGLHASTVNELLRLTLLAPDVVEQWMAGRQPRRLTLMWFQRHPLPVDWRAQRGVIAGFK